MPEHLNSASDREMPSTRRESFGRRGWVILLAVLNAALVAAIVYPNVEGGKVRSRDAWTAESNREIAQARHRAQQKAIELTRPPYWGPLTPEMAARIALDPQWIIGPYNLDPPASGWLHGPKYNTDRGWTVRIKGNSFWIYEGEGEFFAIIGRGVDGKLQLTREHLEALEEGSPEAVLAVDALLYDPTNGTFSSGDYIRTEPEPFFRHFERARRYR